MPLNMLFYVKQFLTFFSKAAGKFGIMQFEHLSIKYSKKINYRLKRDIADLNFEKIRSPLSLRQFVRTSDHRT